MQVERRTSNVDCPTPKQVIACVALGSNLGDRRANIETAVRALRDTFGVKLLAVSSLLDNPAVGGPADSPPFLNGAAVMETALSPQRLLSRLLQIEREMGRDRRQKWEPRIIDLDVLLFGDQVLQTPTLTVPHPLMHLRRFVLQPLAEIAPNAVHPASGKTVAGLLSELSDVAPA